MSVTFPEYVQVGAHKYKVIFPYVFREDKGLYGQIDYAINEIRINGVDSNGIKLPDTVLVTTFFHELFHAISNVFTNRECNNERDIEAFAQGLAQVFCSAQLPDVTE